MEAGKRGSEEQVIADCQFGSPADASIVEVSCPAANTSIIQHHVGNLIRWLKIGPGSDVSEQIRVIVVIFVLQISSIMESAILQTDSDKDLRLILQLAKKLGISARKLSKDEFEDIGLSIAIEEGETGKHVDTETYLKKLRDGSQDR